MAFVECNSKYQEIIRDLLQTHLSLNFGDSNLVIFHLWESDISYEEISGCVPLFQWLARCGR